MGFKVIVFLGIFIGMILLISSRVGAARMLPQTSNTVEPAEKVIGKIIPVNPKIPKKPFCRGGSYGSCIGSRPPAYGRRKCDYKNTCKGRPPTAQP